MSPAKTSQFDLVQTLVLADPSRRTSAPIVAQRAKGSVQLNFQNLSAFERITDQYANQGIKFDGAIALEPSNPLFQTGIGKLVLMPISNQACFSAQFNGDLRQVDVFVSSARPVCLTAYDAEGNLIDQISSDWQQIFSEEGEMRNPLPIQKLELRTANIAKIVLQSYAPFIVTGVDFEANHD
ncbi:MAG: hypothetical protein KME16_07300 [Scytolyngbya sp. HA4215-MV1]|jgi:hypothetical protein|nr:hypothetical protein [Scytolyngbya sp. HA4215-MV1]